MPIEFEKLSATALQSLSAATTVFFFPVGPLEDHGPHLPLGLDLDEARALCRITAGKLETEMPGWKGILMPSAPLGVDSNTTRFAFTVRSYVLRDWLVDTCRSLKRIGFRHFVCYSGHLGPRQLTAIEDAAKIISRRPLRSLLFRNDPKISPHVTLVSASSALVPAQSVRRAPLWTDATEHGGRRDTSIALALNSDSVAPSYATLAEAHRPAPLIARLWGRLLRKTQGYWGTPAQASAQNGTLILTGEVNEIFPKLKAVWEGTHPNFLFRSWYSILPPNKSFAKAWLMAALLLLIVWLYVSLNGVFLI